MKNVLLVAVVFCTAFASCQSARNIKSYSTMDSVAYALGTYYGGGLKSTDSTLNTSVIAAAINDAYKNRSQMTPEDVQSFLNEYFGVRLPAKNKAEGIAWLEDVKAKNSNIKVTESGLMYEIIDAGDMGVVATDDRDQVTVNYRGTLKEGTEFDKGDSISFPLDRVIAAWTEGLKLVGKGGEVILWVPSDLGYGERGNGRTIPSNAPLKFEVKLLDVIPAAPATAE